MRRLPRWLLFLLLVLGIVLLAGLMVPYLLDVDHYRPLIVSAIEKETGRKVTISKIRARLLPTIGFTIEDFGLGNPPGLPQGNLLTVERIHGNLALGALLRREFQLRSVELVKPSLFLLEDDRGRVNYELATPKQSGQPAAGAGFRLASIDTMQLTEAQLTMAGVAEARRRVVPYLHARGVNVQLEDVALDSKSLKQWKGDADLGGVQLELAGLKQPLEFRSGDLKLRKGALESKFQFTAGQIAKVEGHLRVPDIEHAVAAFDVSTPLIDLDQAAAAGVKTAPGPAPTPASQPPVGKSELLGQGHIAIQRIRWASYELNNASADVRVFTDRVEIWPVAAAVYSGTLQISSRVDRRVSPNRFSANLQLRNLDVAKALAASPQTRGKMTGTAQMDLQLFGSLAGNLLNSLTGKGQFAIADGRLPGVSLGNSLQSLAKLQQVFTLGAGSGGFSGETTFRRIDGDLSIGGRRVASNRIHVDSSNGTVDLRGSFGFDQTLAYDGQAVLMRSGGGNAQNPGEAVLGVFRGAIKQTVGRISVPFAVRGTFSDPKIQPGRGLPSVQTGSPSEAAPNQEQQKKKGAFDFFRKP